jgi:hypothetical protein
MSTQLALFPDHQKVAGSARTRQPTNRQMRVSDRITRDGKALVILRPDNTYEVHPYDRSGIGILFRSRIDLDYWLRSRVIDEIEWREKT